jgi:single-strand DNA-binding protein
MANLNFNKVMLGGHITKDPELKQTQSGIPVVSFSVAVNRRVGQENNNEPTADFFNCTAWRKTAELVATYFSKGSSIFVVGRIENRNYTDKDGIKRFATDIIVDEVSFVDSKSESTVQPPITQTKVYGVPSGNNGEKLPSVIPGIGYGKQAANPNVSYEDLALDQDLPF